MQLTPQFQWAPAVHGVMWCLAKHAEIVLIALEEYAISMHIWGAMHVLATRHVPQDHACMNTQLCPLKGKSRNRW